ncbi:MAG: hypothetical protein R3358_00800 [Woeseiaceae bacterium]|nr:hypothetical protein [Woeseiaceae bacterium]
MNWEAASTIAEIVGAAGVIASLIYLAIQIRQSTKVSRAEMTKDLFLASRTAILEIASNDALAKISAEIRQFEDVDEMRRNMFYQSFFRLYELQYNLKNQGLLDDDLAKSYALIIQMWSRTKFFADYWSRHRGEFNEAFASYVDAQVAAAKP